MRPNGQGRAEQRRNTQPLQSNSPHKVTITYSYCIPRMKERQYSFIKIYIFTSQSRNVRKRDREMKDSDCYHWLLLWWEVWYRTVSQLPHSRQASTRWLPSESDRISVRIYVTPLSLYNNLNVLTFYFRFSIHVIYIRCPLFTQSLTNRSVKGQYANIPCLSAWSRHMII